MSLEQALADNTAALNKLAAAMAGGSKPAAAAPAASTKKDEAAASTKAGTHTKAEATAALNEVKEKFGTDVAVALRNEHAKVTKMADLVDPKAIDALFDAAKKKMKEGDEGGGEEEI